MSNPALDSLHAISTVYPRLYIKPTQIMTVIDADTVKVSVPLNALWPDIESYLPHVRLPHVNAAEMSTIEGQNARAAVLGWVSNPEHTNGLLAIFGRDKYGRLLADYVANDDLLSDFVLGLEGSKPMMLKDM